MGTNQNKERYPKDFPLSVEDRLRLRNVLRSAKQRCYSRTAAYYHLYGARGIRICGEWYDEAKNEFHDKSFFTWAYEHGWRQGLQLDRIDTNGNYSPDNCRWVTCKENNRNKRCNRVITINGVSKTASEWAEHVGVPKSVINNRIHIGWNPEDAVLVKKKELKRMVSYKGETLPLVEWSRKTGIPAQAIGKRLKAGWELDRVFSEPSGKFFEKRNIVISFEGKNKTISEWASEKGISRCTLYNRIRSGWPVERVLTTVDGRKRRCS